jgi:hypothetical protein
LNRRVLKVVVLNTCRRFDFDQSIAVAAAEEQIGADQNTTVAKCRFEQQQVTIDGKGSLSLLQGQTGIISIADQAALWIECARYFSNAVTNGETGRQLFANACQVGLMDFQI